jgi:hypothetical protein
MTEDQRQWAIRRVSAKRTFWLHLSVYVLVNALLTLIWVVGSGGDFWPAWPMLGWGIGLGAHAVSVFLAPMAISEERIDRELRSRRASPTSTRSGKG